jgi:hypothetical protein
MKTTKRQSENQHSKIALEAHLSSIENALLVSKLDSSEVNTEIALYDLEQARKCIQNLFNVQPSILQS